VTDRLYYADSYLAAFDARLLEAADDGRRVYLDRSAFYPTSGGQPFDTGALTLTLGDAPAAGTAAVVDVVDEGDRVAHLLDSYVPRFYQDFHASAPPPARAAD
jgi:alanyl-tRNA synthetase